MPNQTFFVRGRVTLEAADLLPTVTVKAYDKDLRHEELLGEATTDQSQGGGYEIGYTASQFRRVGKRQADLIVRVYSSVGKELAVSPVSFNAQPEETINLKISKALYRGSSQLERLHLDLKPLLIGPPFLGANPLIELQDEDISYLAGHTGHSPQAIRMLSHSAKLAKETGLDEDILYALTSQGLQMDLSKLSLMNRSTCRQAIEAALSENIVLEGVASSLEENLDRLHAWAVKYQLNGDLGKLLRTSPTLRNNQELCQAFLSIFLECNDSADGFWQELSQRPEFSEATIVNEFRFTLELNNLVNHHLPLVKIVQNKRQNTGIQSLRDTTRWTRADWQQMISRSGVPPEIPGETEQEKIQNYATEVYQGIETRFPTDIIRQRVKSSGNQVLGSAPLRRFLEATPAFEFGRNRIADYTQPEIQPKNLVVLKGWERLYKLAPAHGRWETMVALKNAGMDSAYKIVQKGHSSFMRSFAEPLGGESQVQQTWANAYHMAATALALYAEFGASFNQVMPAVIPYQPVHEMDGFPSWKELFGPLDYCECEHGRSVYSPAAYLADLFQFLKNATPKDGRTPLQELLNRRPDLAEIELSPENALTLMPYVDLVNEVLENALGRFSLPIDPTLEALEQADFGPLSQLFADAGHALHPPLTFLEEQKGEKWILIDDKKLTYHIYLEGSVINVYLLTKLQTEAKEEELGALPEHLNEAAYAKLVEAVYPWSLPFDLWSEEARVYFKHLGFERDRWMKMLLSPGADAPIRAACEYLAINDVERRIITGDWEEDEQELWGLKSENWLDDLRLVSAYIDQSGLSELSTGHRLITLRQLLAAKYINGDRGIRVEIDEKKWDPLVYAGDPSALEDAPMSHKNETPFYQPGETSPWKKFLRRSVSFMRLLRKLDWSISELDKTLVALNKRVNNATLIHISNIQRLRTELRTPLVEMLSWWSKIDTAIDLSEVETGKRTPSLYEQVFLNKSLENPGTSIFVLNTTQTELKNPNNKISDHAEVVAAALEISIDELSFLLLEDDTLLPQEQKELNLDNLSRLYRIVSFARANHLTTRELLLLKNLTGTNPFEKPEETLALLEHITRISESKFQLKDLLYLLQPVGAIAQERAPSGEDVIRLLGEIRAGLMMIFDDTNAVRNQVIERLCVATGLDSRLVTLLVESLLDGRLQEGNHALEDLAALQQPGLDAEYRTYDLDSGIPPKPKLKQQKVCIDPEIDFKYHNNKWPPLDMGKWGFSVTWRGWVQAERSELFTWIIQGGGRITLKIDGDTIITAQDPLIATGEVTLKAGQFYRIELHQSIALGISHPYGMGIQLSWETPTTPRQIIPARHFVPESIMAACQASYLLIHRLAKLISGFEISADELVYFSEHSGDFQDFNVNRFAADSVSEETGLFSQWEQLQGLFKFRDYYCGRDIQLIDVFAAASQYTKPNQTEQAIKDASDKLLVLTLWDAGDFYILSGTQGFNLSKQDYQGGNKFLELHESFQELRRLGISAKLFLQWVNADFDQPGQVKNTAQELRRAIRSRYSRERWLQAAKSMRDSLREKQQAALVSYLVARDDLKDASDLFARYLIDVEMSPCMLTSRLVQATGAVQLFVQRCLMNLEPEVALSQEEAEEWKWRGNYRVWEANRKVFLYPENWIEPELRDDKSPFFMELEEELLQGEITNESVEIAYRNYLEKLNEVARLPIVAMCETVDEEKKTKTIHVFGRTREQTQKYYYRRRENNSYWTPWEQIDLDIESDHLLPVVWNGQLFLFWIVFTEKNSRFDEEFLTKTGTESIERWKDKELKYWQLGLSWSQYKNAGKWSPRKQCKKYLDNLYVYISALSSEAKFPLPIRIADLLWFGDSIQVSEAIYVYTSYWLKETEFELSKQNLAFNLSVNDDYFAICCYLNAPDEQLNPSDQGKHVFRPMAEFRYYPSNRQVDTIIDPGSIIENISNLKEHEQIKLNKPLTLDGMYITTGDISLKLPPKFPETGNPAPVLNKLLSNPHVLIPHRNLSFRQAYALFAFDDINATFFVTRVPNPYSIGWYYQFEPLYYPHISCLFQQIERYGVDGLLDPPVNSEFYKSRRQMALMEDKDKVIFSKEKYDPTSYVIEPYPLKDVDYSDRGTFSAYNWELFFHIPLLIADRLKQDQCFEEAMKWYHYIFDPKTISKDPDEPAPACYWKFRPFFEAYLEGKPKRIDELMKLINQGDNSLVDEVARWERDPFKPHLIARNRPAAYMKTVVMKYIETLIVWGDQLFRQDSRESINQATQLYLLAAGILGSRPEGLPAPRRQNLPFSELEENLDAFSNALVEIENLLPETLHRRDGSGNGQQHGVPLPILYFCIPNNDKLLGYWDIVADRLFKIRHCMNIEGIVRQLPLFQPPIEPGLLVRAAAAGVDLGSVLRDLTAPLPHYRFQVMLQKALEFCGEVRSLGAALLAVLEKRDSEELGLLRSNQEIRLLKAVKQVRKQQIAEAEQTLESLRRAIALTQTRHEYYKNIKRISPGEKTHLDLLIAASMVQMASQELEMAGSSAHAGPDYIIGGMAGAGGGAITVTKTGGSNVGAAAQAFGQALGMYASQLNTMSTLSSITAGYGRRWEEWKLQERLARKEIEQIEKQISAAEIRVAIAEYELENHERQIEDAEETIAFLRDKFTNRQLYSWMVSKISSIYFQSYQMAYDLARGAEKAYQHELGLTDTNYVQFGYWDSLKKGLMAGEQLHFDIKRMEFAYLEQNKREYEITKHISLAMLDPYELMKLKETGQCYVNLPEVLFDLDYPGHYMRRIKSVSLTIPCVTGPYTSVYCKLTLDSNRIRCSTSTSNGYAWENNFEDDRFKYNVGGIQTITTSSAQNDPGLFELTFRDERYLPFEGAGVISKWTLQLSGKWHDKDGNLLLDLPQFDFSTISDVLLHMRYTAREGGDGLQTVVLESMVEELNALATEEQGQGLMRLFSFRHEFPGEWHNLKLGKRALFTITKQQFPFFVQSLNPTIQNAALYARVKDVSPGIKIKKNETEDINFPTEPIINNILESESISVTLDVNFTIEAENAENLDELILLVKYKIQS